MKIFLLTRSSIFRAEIFFLGLLLVIGLPLVFVTPPFQAPDEYAHFYRTFALSDLDFTSRAGQLPKSIAAVSQPVKELPAHPDERIRVSDLLQVWNVPLSPDNRKFTSYRSATAYPPLIYVPQLLGMWLARALGFGPFGLLIIGRVFNLLFFGLLGYLTLRLLPSYRWLFASLLLMPMLVFLAASLSPDAMTDSLALLMIAYVFRLTSDKVKMVTWREAAWLALLSALVAATKIPYFMLSLALFIIPHEKFGSWKQYGKKIGLIFGVVLVVVILFQIPNFIGEGNANNMGISQEVEPSQRFEQFLQKPQVFLSMLYPTFYYYGALYIKGYIGFLGWNDTLLPRLLYITYLAVPLGLAFVEGSPGMRLKALQRILLFALPAVIIFLLHFLLYISFTPNGSITILGIQGRYFIPLGPLVFMALSGVIHNEKLSRWAIIAAAMYLPVAELFMVRAVVIRYYIGL